MPDGLVQWFDVRHAEGRVVHGGRQYRLRAEDAEPAARHAGARVHFDIVRDHGSEQAANVRLCRGTRVSPRQRRFGDLVGARRPDAKGFAPFAHAHGDLARGVQADPGRVARAWARRMEAGDLDGAILLYAPNAALHVGGVTVRGRARLQDCLSDSACFGAGVAAQFEGPGQEGITTLRWPGRDGEACVIRLRITHGEISEQWLDGEPSAAGGAGAAEIAVVSRGAVPEDARSYALQKIARVIEQAELPVLFARVKLLHHGDPARERSAVVEASLDVDGRLVRAHRGAHDFREAVDLAEERLRDRLRHLADHRRQLSRGGAPFVPGEWRHASRPTIRPECFPRPPDDRELVRQKALPLGEMTVDEAAFDMELLDHDFYLFREIGGAGDSLLAREGGRLRLLRTGAAPPLAPETTGEVGSAPPPELDVDEAIERMNASAEPFVFFRDRDSGRGEVLYRRYDGHYGLIEPAD